MRVIEGGKELTKPKVQGNGSTSRRDPLQTRIYVKNLLRWGVSYEYRDLSRSTVTRSRGNNTDEVVVYVRLQKSSENQVNVYGWNVIGV